MLKLSLRAQFAVIPFFEASSIAIAAYRAMAAPRAASAVFIPSQGADDAPIQGILSSAAVRSPDGAIDTT